MLKRNNKSQAHSVTSFLTLSLDTGDTRSTTSVRTTRHTQFLSTFSLETNLLISIFNSSIILLSLILQINLFQYFKWETRSSVSTFLFIYSQACPCHTANILSFRALLLLSCQKYAYAKFEL